MIAPVYDWTGFYIGAAAAGFGRNCWDFVDRAGALVRAEGCHDATGGTTGKPKSATAGEGRLYIVIGLELKGRSGAEALGNSANASTKICLPGYASTSARPEEDLTRSD
jgi:hypothetical protein